MSGRKEGIFKIEVIQFKKQRHNIIRNVISDMYLEEVLYMTERMTWKEIQEKYPDQWVGLVDVEYINNDGVSIETAVVKYVDKSKSELTRLALEGEIVSRYTTPDSIFQLGMVGVQ